ncbi:hypothetical protein KY366_04375 [Candidatus Woesearchaeota archaeon]|nr:hypothetical protein [Candidatus Woesearchaeota archaeon]
MDDEETRIKKEVHKWVDDYLRKPSGTGIGDSHAKGIKNYFDKKKIEELKIKNVDQAKEHIKGYLNSDDKIFINPKIHKAMKKHILEGGEDEIARRKAEESNREVKSIWGRDAEEFAEEANEKYRERKSIWGRDVRDIIKDTQPYKKAAEKAQQAKKWAGDKARWADQFSDDYFPTFKGFAKEKGSKGIEWFKKVVSSRSQGKEESKADKAKEKPKTEEGNFFALLLIFLTLALVFIDYKWTYFGGLDYRVYLDVWRAGGFAVLWMTFVPIYTLALLLIIWLRFITKEHKTAYTFMLVVGVLLIANTLSTIFGIKIIPIIGLPVSIVALIGAMIFSTLKFMDQDERNDFLSWVMLFFVVSAILSLGGHESIGGLLHLIIATLVWFFIIDTEKNKTAANHWVALGLAIDFFGFGILKALIPLASNSSLIANRFVFPIWFLFVTFYSAEYKRSRLIKAVTFGVFIFYLIALVEGAYGWQNIQAGMKVSPEERAEAKSFGKLLMDKLRSFPGKIVAEYQEGMEYATGGYYQGKVEENQDPRNELGVHIENLEAADKQFYQNEQVVIWGDLRARTLEEPINVSISCEAGGVNGTIVPAELGGEKGYEIEKLEEIPFECVFDRENRLKAGTQTIKVKTRFSFQTYGYLKAYFMDIERMRALRREDVNPLKEYGIEETPKAIYTNGPVKLGMGTISSLVGLNRESGTDSAGYSYIGVTVQPQWLGRIEKITNITIQIPEDMDISDYKSGTFCREGFEPIGSNEGNTIYKITNAEINRIKIPITTYKSWRCPIDIPKDKVNNILGNTPVAVHYYRAGVSYVYEIEKSISVFIKNVPEYQEEFKGCKTECNDSDGCRCMSDECCVPKEGIITKGYTCDDYPSGNNRCRGYERIIKDVNEADLEIDAYLALNLLCAQGSDDLTMINDVLTSKGFKVDYWTEKNEEAVKKVVESKGFAIDSEASQAIKQLIDKCSGEYTKVNYVQSGEKKIADKIAETTAIFHNVEANLKEDLKDPVKKANLNKKKTRFIEQVQEAKKDFQIIKEYMLKNYNKIIDDKIYLERLDKAEADLGGLGY